MLRVKTSTWFNEVGSSSRIGIVIAENDEGVESAYIGSVSGRELSNGRTSNEYKVLKYGACFPLYQAKSIMTDGESEAAA